MAGIVKWLRPRIVVPIYMGSNPITRPISNKSSVRCSQMQNMTDFLLVRNSPETYWTPFG